ncbi:MAG TPA: copper resistance protein CopC [Alphaproteobacteria bacterium]|nr:copper resistance protein CopC [Alphaproteobacteria bacterium]
MNRFWKAFAPGLVLVPLWAAGAFAHAVLIEAEPKDGAALAAAPAEARLRFNEPVDPVIVRLLTPDGSSRVLEPRATDTTVSAPLPNDLANGTYVLSYRVISADSHPVAGSLVFAVGVGAPVAPATKATTGPRWEAVFPWLHGAALIALLLAVGGAVVGAFVLPKEARKTRDTARYRRIAAVIGALAAIAAVGVRGAGLADSPLAEIVTATPWRIALETAMGPGLALNVIAAAAAVVATFARAGLERALALVALAALAWGFATTSHAAVAPPVALSFPAYMVHIAVAAFWLGSLPLLAVALTREPLAVARTVVKDFSRIATWAVAALTVAGVVLTATQTGPDLSVWLGPAWSNTAYGGLLAAKIVAALIVLAFALHHKRKLTPLLAKHREGALRLRRSIVWEGAVMVAVIGLAAVLSQSSPPRSVSAAALLAEHHSSGAETGAVIDATRDGVEILLEVDPATPGPNQFIVHFFDASKGEHIYPSEVTVAVSLPDGGVEPLRRPAISQGDDTYRVEGMPLPVPGIWQVRIEALLTDFDKLIVTMELPVEAP